MKWYNLIFIQLYCCNFYFCRSDDMEGANVVEDGGGSGKLFLSKVVSDIRIDP
jgi:hypothetical protein